MGARGPKAGTKYRSKPGPKPNKDRAAKPARPVVRTSYGIRTCLFCKKKFEASRPWSKYDSTYCKMMHWHTLNRRRNPPGNIVERDGHMLAEPLPVFDPKAEIEAELIQRMGVEKFEAEKKRLLEEMLKQTK